MIFRIFLYGLIAVQFMFCRSYVIIGEYNPPENYNSTIDNSDEITSDDLDISAEEEDVDEETIRYSHSTTSHLYADISEDDFEEYFEPKGHVLFGRNTKIFKTSSRGSGANKKIFYTEDNQILSNLQYTDNVKDPQPVTANSTDYLNSRGTAYIEIVVAVHYSLYTHFNKNDLKIIKYLANFWTAVDLRFRNMTDPPVRLSIAGIILATDKAATPYVKTVFGQVIDADSTLQQVREKAKARDFSHLPNINYDAFMIMSRDRLVMKTKTKQLVQVSGYSQRESTCYINSTLAVGLFRNRGRFSSIQTAAHELAHIIGATHDIADEGYIMSNSLKPVHTGNNRWFFSDASRKSMSTFLTSAQAKKCLYNKPNIGSPIKKTFGGFQYSRRNQCSALYRYALKLVTALGNGDQACEALYCKIWLSFTGPKVKYTGVPPVEGSECDNNKICLNGKCVGMPKELGNN